MKEKKTESRSQKLYQIRGALPRGYDLDSLLTVEQFAAWQQVSAETARSALAGMKGVIRRSQKWVRIHPRSFLQLTLAR